MSREFGIHPENENLRCWWGARAIITRRNFELLPDRQCAEFNCTPEEKRKFISFINSVIIPDLENATKRGDTSLIHKVYDTVEDGNSITLIAQDRNSGGYLYIGAWQE